MITLGCVAEIRMGYTYRGSLKGAASGNTAVIQMKDASPEAIGQTGAFARTELPSIPDHHLLREGDLIFRSRGLQTTTVLIEQALPRTICIAPLMVIRVLPAQLALPAYLQWFINLADTQNKMNAYARGSAIRMIAAQSMAELALVLPPLACQHEIVATAKLNREILVLEARLAEKRQRYTDEALLQFAQEQMSAAADAGLAA